MLNRRVAQKLDQLRQIIESRESEERAKRLAADLGDPVAARDVMRATTRRLSYAVLPASPGDLISDAGRKIGKLSWKQTRLSPGRSSSDMSRVDFRHWSIWDGQPAAVEFEYFDEKSLARMFSVRLALDMNSRPLPKGNVDARVLVGSPTVSSGAWHMPRGVLPHGVTEGTWGTATVHKVGVSIKDLSDSEQGKVISHWRDQRLVDISGLPESCTRKKTEVAQVLALDSFVKTQDLPPRQANTADAMVTAQLGRYAKNNMEEQEAWVQIPGVFRVGAKGRIDYVIFRSESGVKSY